jgi:heme/copper-type cytochrome/quinol oxidase subunit 2
MTTATIESALMETKKAIASMENDLKKVQLDHLASEYRSKSRSIAFKKNMQDAYQEITSATYFNLVEAEEAFKQIVIEEKDLGSHDEISINAPNGETQKIIDRLEDKLITKGRILRSIDQMKQNHNSNLDKHTLDDFIQTDTLYLQKGREYEFSFRSKDVIHSAYFPHFRAQMNVVPGMPTRTKFTPSLTTVEMQKKKGDPNFNFVLMCNKICGTAHYKMKLIIVVLNEANYKEWKSTKKVKTFRDTYSAGSEDENSDSE